jgi:uncharacterized protein (TIGR02452 family)
VERTQAANLGRETLDLIAEGRYANARGERVPLADLVADCVARTELIRPADWRSIHRRADEAGSPASVGPDRHTAARPRWPVTVTPETTLAAARRLVAGRNPMPGGLADVLALNFASGKNPGGGFLGGSRAQEESIARSSALHPSLLAQQAYYDANRGGPKDVYTDHAIYSPGVPVFRADDGALLDEPYLVSVLTMPAPNVRAMRQNGRVDEALAADTMARRIGHVLAFAAARGHRTLVLGAWGCGAFGNDAETVADLFRDALRTPVAACFDDVTFAVFDLLDGQPVLSAFRESLAA